MYNGLVSDANVKNYAEAWRRRFARYRQEDRARSRAARGSLGRAVEILKEYGATRVLLFGSLASGQFTSRSDIDLAVEGVPADKLTRVFADLMMALDFSVDLKPLEEVDPSFREVVLAKGILLYEKT